MDTSEDICIYKDYTALTGSVCNKTVQQKLVCWSGMVVHICDLSP